MALSDPKERFRFLVSMIVAMALFGALLILLLSAAWRRFNRRQWRRDRQAATPPTDAWRIAGQRMPTPPPEPPDSPENPGSFEDPNLPEFPLDDEPE